MSNSQTSRAIRWKWGFVTISVCIGKHRGCDQDNCRDSALCLSGPPEDRFGLDDANGSVGSGDRQGPLIHPIPPPVPTVSPHFRSGLSTFIRLRSLTSSFQHTDDFFRSSYSRPVGLGCNPYSGGESGWSGTSMVMDNAHNGIFAPAFRLIVLQMGCNAAIWQLNYRSADHTFVRRFLCPGQLQPRADQFKTVAFCLPFNYTEEMGNVIGLRFQANGIGRHQYTPFKDSALPWLRSPGSQQERDSTKFVRHEFTHCLIIEAIHFCLRRHAGLDQKRLD